MATVLTSPPKVTMCWSVLNTNKHSVVLLQDFITNTIPLKSGTLTKLSVSSYSGKIAVPVFQLTEQQLKSKIGNEMAENIKDTFNKRAVKTMEGCSYNLFLNNEKNVKITALHNDNKDVLLIVLEGFKRIYVGPRTMSVTFFDMMNREWQYKEDTCSFTIIGRDIGTITEQEDDLRTANIFRRLTLGPGDAVVIPRDYLHAVLTHPDTLSVSIDLKT